MKKNKIFAIIFSVLMTLCFTLEVSAATPSANSLTFRVIDTDVTEIYGGMKDGKITAYKQALYNPDGTIHSYV